ncbi:MAG: glycosyltransferase family 4 protein [Armatimonadetes bacterium]|nr:glycosyltransferase family 4 protein [Armatimonadota bacterium]
MPARPLKIVLVPASYLPCVGGLQTAIRYLAQEFQAAGHRVEIVTNRYPRSLSAYEEMDGVPVHRILFAGLSLPPLSATNLIKYIAQVGLLPISLARWLILLRRLRPDILNVHFAGDACGYAWIASRLLDFKLVVSLHGEDVRTLPRQSSWRRWVQGRLLDRSHAVTACSAFLLKESGLEASLQGKAYVTHNGVSPLPPETESVEPPPHPYLFAVGRLVHKKGFDLLVSAFRQAGGLERHLYIGGDGPEKRRLEALIGQSGLSERVHLLGRLSPPQVYRWMQGAELIIVPSRDEPFGIVVLEGMLAGRAVLACRTGGIPEIIEHGRTGWLVEAGSAEALAEGIARLLGAPDERERLGKAGLEVARTEFTWRQAAARYLDVFRKV